MKGLFSFCWPLLSFSCQFLFYFLLSKVSISDFMNGLVAWLWFMVQTLCEAAYPHHVPPSHGFHSWTQLPIWQCGGMKDGSPWPTNTCGKDSWFHDGTVSIFRSFIQAKDLKFKHTTVQPCPQISLACLKFFIQWVQQMRWMRCG